MALQEDVENIVDVEDTNMEVSRRVTWLKDPVIVNIIKCRELQCHMK